MIISPFQALVLLAQKYRNSAPHTEESRKFTHVKHLFLVGVQNDEDRKLLNSLLSDDVLAEYQVALGNKVLITNDPVRRYFESVLVHDTVKTTIDTLDEAMLNRYFNLVYAAMPLYLRILTPATIYKGSINGIASKFSDTAPEYIAAFRKFKNPNNFLSFKPSLDVTSGSTPEEKEQNAAKHLQERMDKMMLLIKTVHSSMAAVSEDNLKFPLNIYGKKNSAYQPVRRGLIPRKDEYGIRQQVRSHNLGIMRSFHPLSSDSILHSDPDEPTTGKHRRAADNSTYQDGAEYPERLFGTEVSPFVNSISGTLLCVLRVMLKVLHDGKLEYRDNPQQLNALMKSMIGYLMFILGGHSLQEFMFVFEIPEIQAAFSEIPMFREFTLKTLFQNENEAAFLTAMDSVILYNDQIISKSKVHHELVPDSEVIRKKQKDAVITDDVLVKEARKRLKKSSSHKDPIEKRDQIIDKAYTEYSRTDGSQKEHQKAREILITRLRIKLLAPNNESEVDRKIQKAMEDRQAELRASLFTNGHGTIAKKLDKAWEIYQNKDRTIEDRQIAMEYLIFVLNLDEKHILGGKLDEILHEKMLSRELVKGINPEYIPGKSPLAHYSEKSKADLKKHRLSPEITNAIANKDLLEVTARSKKKDKRLKTHFYNEEERELFHVLIRKGTFIQDDKYVDTGESFSHGKKGFAAFTINVHGELSLFQHIDFEKTKIGHSTMNAGVPVFAAGELRIERGVITGITDYSGHYRPSLYNTYKALEYFKSQGVAVDEVQVLSLAKPSKLNIVFQKSPEYSPFYEMNAGDVCCAYRAHLRETIVTAHEGLKRYKSPGFMNVLYFIKDYFTESTLTSERMKTATKLAKQLVLMSKKISRLRTVDEMKAFSAELKSICSDAEKENQSISTKHKKSNSRLAQKIGMFREKLDKSEQIREEDYHQSLKGTTRG